MSLSDDLQTEIAHLEDRVAEAGALEEELAAMHEGYGLLTAENAALRADVDELVRFAVSYPPLCPLGAAGEVDALEAACGVLTYRRVYHAEDVFTPSAERQLIGAGYKVASSFKPGTRRWAEVARGDHDAWLARVAGAYGSVGGEIDVALLHEPVDDAKRTSQRSADYAAMQTRWAALAEEHAPNIRPVVCLTAYDYRSGAAESFVPKSAKLVAADGYDWCPETGRAGGTPATIFTGLVEFAQSRGVQAAIWETGSANDRGAYITKLRSWLKANPIVRACMWFEHPVTSFNRCDWRIVGDGEAEAAWAAMNADPWFARR